MGVGAAEVTALAKVAAVSWVVERAAVKAAVSMAAEMVAAMAAVLREAAAKAERVGVLQDVAAKAVVLREAAVRAAVERVAGMVRAVAVRAAEAMAEARAGSVAAVGRAAAAAGMVAGGAAAVAMAHWHRTICSSRVCLRRYQVRGGWPQRCRASKHAIARQGRHSVRPQGVEQRMRRHVLLDDGKFPRLHNVGRVSKARRDNIEQ